MQNEGHEETVIRRGLMAAFERVLSGIPKMDHALGNICLGDNVVWQVTKLEEFRLFLDPYVEQAIRDGRNLIYVRFAFHESLVKKQPGKKSCLWNYPTSSRTLLWRFII